MRDKFFTAHYDEKTQSVTRRNINIILYSLIDLILNICPIKASLSKHADLRESLDFLSPSIPTGYH